MPKDGDIIESYCQHCGRVTTHVFHGGCFLPGKWKCLGHEK